MEDNLILKYSSALIYLNSLILIKKLLVLLNIMGEAVISEDSHMVETGVVQVVLEEDNKVEVHQVVQGIKKLLYLLAIWLTLQIPMK